MLRGHSESKRFLLGFDGSGPLPTHASATGRSRVGVGVWHARRVHVTPLGRPATICWVALGGTLGTAVRYGALEAAGPPSGWPYVTFTVNLIGSFLLGWLVEALPRHERVRLLAGTGFCGGLTTYSTFAVELTLLGRADRFGLAVAYLFASVLGGLGAAAAGLRLGRRFDATPGRTT